jgi:hypothetical protein
MAITVRLAGLGEDQEARNITITRMQRLENALSGYYAAFGTYPPVALHASHNIYLKADSHGTQSAEEENKNIWGWSEIGQQSEIEAWQQVEAACRAQPIDCRFPFPPGYEDVVEAVSEEMKRRASSDDEDFKKYYENEDVKRKLLAGFDDGTSNIGRFSALKDKEEWHNLQLFKFGLLSYLLPRYLVMMNGPEVFFEEYAQWIGNNVMPSNPFTGKSFNTYGGWRGIKDRTAIGNESTMDYASVANVPSQAVCARWMPNLKNICRVNRPEKFVLFGIDIKDGSGSTLNVENPYIEVFSTTKNASNQYVLDGVTVCDGWGNDFYYYSPSPYQRYTLWSSGPNGRTFPPWIDRNTLESKANECVGKWVFDDIIHLSN